MKKYLFSSLLLLASLAYFFLVITVPSGETVSYRDILDNNNLVVITNDDSTGTDFYFTLHRDLKHYKSYFRFKVENVLVTTPFNKKNYSNKLAFTLFFPEKTISEESFAELKTKLIQVIPSSLQKAASSVSGDWYSHGNVEMSYEELFNINLNNALQESPKFSKFLVGEVRIYRIDDAKVSFSDVLAQQLENRRNELYDRLYDAIVDSLNSK